MSVRNNSGLYSIICLIIKNQIYEIKNFYGNIGLDSYCGG